jgi:peptide-methionine (S)-S-oxide reductase
MSTETPFSATDRVVLAGGCFWCTEAVFSELRGVRSAVPGYAGGTVPNPSYEQVCTGRTGHAEAVEVTFEPGAVSLHDLLVVFFTTHDPTTRDRQGPDVGTQYRSAVFYRTAEQKAVAESVVREITEEKVYSRPVVTELAPLTVFYPAEEYHRNYFRRHPEQAYCAAVIAPKLAKFRAKHAERLARAPWSAETAA